MSDYEKELDRLSEAECEAFYRWTHDPTPENKAAHTNTKARLEAFAQTGKGA